MSSVDTEKPELGTGLWRGPGERWPGPPSEHAPVAPFGPFGEAIADQAMKRGTGARGLRVLGAIYPA